MITDSSIGLWDSVEEANHNMDGLVEAVRTAVYESFEPMKLNCLFLNIQFILEEVINRQGDNDYDIPHIGKAALERQRVTRGNLIGKAFLRQHCPTVQLALN